MRAFLFRCLSGLALVNGLTTGAMAQVLSPVRLEPPVTASQQALVNPRATACTDLVESCGAIEIDSHSLRLIAPALSLNLDGSLTITATGNWSNGSDGLGSRQAAVQIRIPRQLLPLAMPQPHAARVESRVSRESLAVGCGLSQPVEGARMSLVQLSENLMGQQPVSQSAALFTNPCLR